MDTRSLPSHFGCRIAYIVAIIRDTSGGVLVSGNMQYFFFFGKDGKLLKATADRAMTGP
jgi:hypothetical protein